jgi:hypothetical protein
MPLRSRSAIVAIQRSTKRFSGSPSLRGCPLGVVGPPSRPRQRPSHRVRRGAGNRGSVPRPDPYDLERRVPSFCAALCLSARQWGLVHWRFTWRTCAVRRRHRHRTVRCHPSFRLRFTRSPSDPNSVGRLALAAGTAVVALLVAAAANAAPTRPQFIKRGDALCRQLQRELTPLRSATEDAKSLPESQMWVGLHAIWSAQVDIQARFNARFRALGLPAHDTKARRIVAGLDRGLLLARRIRNGFAARDTAALASTLPAYVRFTLSLNRRVSAYGFTVCGRS